MLRTEVSQTGHKEARCNIVTQAIAQGL